jgi:hypothetical protein
VGISDDADFLEPSLAAVAFMFLAGVVVVLVLVR